MNNLRRCILALGTTVLLAACGTDSITAPDHAAPGRGRRDITISPSDTTGTRNTDVTCPGPVIATVDVLGITTTTCAVDNRGPTVGSGN